MVGVDIPQIEILGDRRGVDSNSPKHIVAVSNVFEKSCGHPLRSWETSYCSPYARRMRQRILKKVGFGMPKGGRRYWILGRSAALREALVAGSTAAPDSELDVVAVKSVLARKIGKAQRKSR